MKIGLHMIVAGDPSPVIDCIKAQEGLFDCGVILVDSKEESDDLYQQLYDLNIPDLVLLRYVWQDSFAHARNTALDKTLLLFKEIDYIYWVDGDDVWAPGTDLTSLRQRIEEERPDAVSLPYQYSAAAKLNRNRFWKVTNGQVAYYWRGGAHEVEWAKREWPSVTHWDDYVLLHTREQEASPDKSKRDRNVRILTKACEEDPTFYRNYYYLGQELFHNEAYREAIRPLEAYIKLSDNVVEKYQAYLILAQVLYNLKLVDRSLRALDKAIELYPDSQFAYSLKGSFLAAQEKWEEAIPWLNMAIKVPGAPVIFDYETQRTVVPLRWLSVCYNKIGNKENAYLFHYLANSCKFDDGLRRVNSMWLSCNKLLKESESEHFKNTDPGNTIDLTKYMLVENFNELSVKQGLLGAMDYNLEMKIVRILNEGTNNEIAVVFKGIPDYMETITIGERYSLQKADYKSLFRSEQFSLYENFYNTWIDFAAKRSHSDILSVVELGTDIGLSARLIKDQIVKYRGEEYYDITLVDTNLTKEAWAIIDDKNIFFIHGRAENAVEFFEDGSIDILHMDLAPHSYEQARDIFRLYKSKLTKEGIMLWHDVGESRRFTFGGRKFLDELRFPWCVSYCEEDDSMSDEAPAVVWKEIL